MLETSSLRTDRLYVNGHQHGNAVVVTTNGDYWLCRDTLLGLPVVVVAPHNERPQVAARYEVVERMEIERVEA